IDETAALASHDQELVICDIEQQIPLPEDDLAVIQTTEVADHPFHAGFHNFLLTGVCHQIPFLRQRALSMLDLTSRRCHDFLDRDQLHAVVLASQAGWMKANSTVKSFI